MDFRLPEKLKMLLSPVIQTPRAQFVAMRRKHTSSLSFIGHVQTPLKG